MDGGRSTTEITMDEWRAELERLGKLGDDGNTIAELAAGLGVGTTKMKKIVRAGVQEGRYIQGFAGRMDTIGRRQRVPVYRLKGKGKGARP